MTRRIEDEKIKIAMSLNELHSEMMLLACSMQYIAGFDPAWGAKADELIGMAAKAQEWSRSIESGAI